MGKRKEHRINRREFLNKTGKTIVLTTITAAMPSALSKCSKRPSDAAFDILIKGGKVFDGTQSGPRRTDIGINGDRIDVVGDINKNAARIIDASGCLVTPGFIDVHTHCDLTFSRSGWRRHLVHLKPSWKGNYNYLFQGVTTVITGNCGYGYTDIERWFGIVDSIKFGTNVGHLVPHGEIREELFADKQPRELSITQLNAMKERVAEEMERGAMGLSVGLEYAPGYIASTGELMELARVAGRYGGVFAIHMRDESGDINANGRVGILESIREAVDIGRQAEIPVQISHLKISSPINNVKASQVLELLDKASDEGLDITADQYPYDAGSTHLAYLVPLEFQTSTGIKDEFKTDKGRKEIREAVEKTFAHLPPDKVLITMYPEKDDYEGKTLKEIAAAEGRNPVDSYLDMVCEDEAPGGVYFNQDIDIVRELMPHDFVLTGSDGYTVPKNMTHPHPRCYGTFPRKLQRFVLDEKLMSLGQAIRSMTSLPANKFNLKGRGEIAEGNFADIAVIDPEKLKDRATFKDPHQYALGVDYLLVNGEISIENGKASGDRKGQAIKRT
jgi:N-acyl-D-aspartate/D-glutamate deacylase